MKNTVFRLGFVFALALACAVGITTSSFLASSAHAVTRNIAARYDDPGTGDLPLNTDGGDTTFVTSAIDGRQDITLLALNSDTSASTPSCQATLGLSVFKSSTFFEYVNIQVPPGTAFKAIEYTLNWTDDGKSQSQNYGATFHGEQKYVVDASNGLYGWAGEDDINSTKVSSGNLSDVFIDTADGKIKCDTTNASATPDQSDSDGNFINKCDGSNHLQCTIHPYKSHN